MDSQKRFEIVSTYKASAKLILQLAKKQDKEAEAILTEFDRNVTAHINKEARLQNERLVTETVEIMAHQKAFVYAMINLFAVDGNEVDAYSKNFQGYMKDFFNDVPTRA